MSFGADTAVAGPRDGRLAWTRPWRDLQKLKKLMDLPTRDLVLEFLIADAVREREAEAQTTRQKG